VPLIKYTEPLGTTVFPSRVLIHGTFPELNALFIVLFAFVEFIKQMLNDELTIALEKENAVKLAVIGNENAFRL